MSIQELDDVLKSNLLADTLRGLNEAAVQDTVATDQWTLPPRSEELSSVRPLALGVEMVVAYESPPARNPPGTGEMADSEEPASPPEGSAEGASPRGSGINPGPMVGEDNNDEN